MQVTVSFCDGNTHGPVNELAYLHRTGSHVDILTSHIFEQRYQIHFLLVVSSHGGRRRLPHNCDNRTMIHFRIIETIQQVDCAWARGCQTNPDFIGKFCMRSCHECSHLLMSHLHKLKEIQVTLKASQDTIDAIAGVAKNTLDTPG